MNPYVLALTQAMTTLGQREDAIFVGQATRFPGTAMFQTLIDVPMEQRVEFPVAENTQLGVSTGLALAGLLPISIFPRMNFLLEAMGQLVNHLDRLHGYSHGEWRPRVIIRTAVPYSKPMNPGLQHLGDFCAGLRMMLRTVRVVELTVAANIVPAYLAAAEARDSTILVERMEMYQ